MRKLGHRPAWESVVVSRQCRWFQSRETSANSRNKIAPRHRPLQQTEDRSTLDPTKANRHIFSIYFRHVQLRRKLATPCQRITQNDTVERLFIKYGLIQGIERREAFVRRGKSGRRENAGRAHAHPTGWGIRFKQAVCGSRHQVGDVGTDIKMDRRSLAPVAYRYVR